MVTEILRRHPLIEIHHEELHSIPDDITILATGPLTSEGLADSLTRLVGRESLYFYDAISPIVSYESLDLNAMFFASRYGKGAADFINIPLTRDQYEEFVSDLLVADTQPLHEFEEKKYFESCLPIEVLARRGKLTLAFGPMKPVGLVDPKTGRRPFAVIQLRAENRHRTAYNLVGFQTKIKYGDQVELFRKLPGLGRAEFLRLGGIHRNTYINSPELIRPTLQLRKSPEIIVAGQLVGTEGYLESAATGLVAGFNAVCLAQGKEPVALPPATMVGALLSAISDPEKKHFQPINANMGVLPPLSPALATKDARKIAMSHRALSQLKLWQERTQRSWGGGLLCRPP